MNNLEFLHSFIHYLTFPSVPDESMADTPQRFVNAYKEMTDGYRQDPLAHIKVFEVSSAQAIISIKDIEFFSLCEHHLLPFFGKVSITYKPANNRVLGLSKFGRIVDVFAKRFQVQERLTKQIADCLFESELSPIWVDVVIEAKHLCQVMRGSKKQNPIMLTKYRREREING